MWPLGIAFRAIALAATSVCLATCLFADTIVLKNGKRIVALSTFEEGDKIRYETSAGELTLPKSIVDHIEKGAVPVAADLSASGAVQLNIAPPMSSAIAGASGAESNVLRNGVVDRAFISQTDVAASSGRTNDIATAAMAHHAAAQFELNHGDIESALNDERTALKYDPNQTVFLLGVAYLQLRRSEFQSALDTLDRARQLAPQDPDVAKLSGWAYYGLNKSDQAVAEWKRAYALRPDRDVESALEKAERDKREEASYKQNESSHFTLRYNGAAAPDLAHDVLRTLESHYDSISYELNFTPRDPIGVILYTQEAFADITRAPGWVGALNDGRIRVPVQGLTSMTPELSRVLKHELTHSFVSQKTQGRAPTWLQEGLAQYMEGKRSDSIANSLLQNQRGFSLSSLEGNWMRFSDEEAAYAYAWSLATVEYIIRNGTMTDIDRILDRIAAGDSADTAVREVTRVDYGDLAQATVGFLEKSYGP